MKFKNKEHMNIKTNFDLLKTLKLDNLLTPGIRNGVYAMLMKIR